MATIRAEGVVAAHGLDPWQVQKIANYFLKIYKDNPNLVVRDGEYHRENLHSILREYSTYHFVQHMRSRMSGTYDDIG